MNHAWMLALLAAALAGCHNTGIGGDPFAGRTRLDAPPTGSLGGNPYLSGSGVPGGSTLQPPTITGPSGNTTMFAPSWSGAPATGLPPATGAPQPSGWGWPSPWGSAPANPTVPQPTMPGSNWNQPSTSGGWPGFLQPSTWGTPGPPVQPAPPTQPNTGWGAPSGTQMFPTWMQPTSAPAPPPGTNLPYPGRASLASPGNEALTSAVPASGPPGWRSPAGGVSPASYQAPIAGPTAPPVVSGPAIGGLSREEAPRISGPSSALPPQELSRFPR